jgi:hypothetical protein
MFWRSHAFTLFSCTSAQSSRLRFFGISFHQRTVLFRIILERRERSQRQILFSLERGITIKLKKVIAHEGSPVPRFFFLFVVFLNLVVKSFEFGIALHSTNSHRLSAYTLCSVYSLSCLNIFLILLFLPSVLLPSLVAPTPLQPLPSLFSTLLDLR